MSAMILSTGDIYYGTVSSTAVNTPGLDYYITATDGQSSASDPPVDPANNPYQLAILPNVAPEITHIPVTVLTPGVPITITATITDNTNYLASATLSYKKCGQLLYQNVVMTNIGESNYQAIIPADYVTNDGVEYYIFAKDDLGVGRLSGVYRIWPYLQITTTSLPNGEVDKFYSFSLSCAGEKPPYFWSSKNLPFGLSLRLGKITGTPTSPGSFTFTATVVDSSSHIATKSLTLVITGEAPSFPDTFITEALLNQRSAFFAWSGSSSLILVYSYKLGGYDGYWTKDSLNTQTSYSNLPNGTYTFFVRAKDSKGNEDPTPASYTFCIKIEAQELKIKSFTASPNNSDSSPYKVNFHCEAEGDSLNYLFDFGDWDYSGWIENNNIEHTYANSGVYKAKVVVADKTGAHFEETITIRIDDLLAKYAPILSFNKGETYFPTRAEEIVGPNSTLVIIEGDVLNIKNGYIDINDEYIEKQRGKFPEPPLVYGRIEPDGDKTYLQYWFFYIYNDWANKHEGDWEMITIELEKDEPTRIVYTRHDLLDEKKDWDDAKVLEWKELKDGINKVGNHPIVYVARGSHASYPESGKTFIPGFGDDLHSGDGSIFIPHTYQLPLINEPSKHWEWIKIKGLKWGNQTGVTGSNGPSSPVAKGDKWDNPKKWLNSIFLLSQAVSVTEEIREIADNTVNTIKTSVDNSIEKIRFTIAHWIPLGKGKKDYGIQSINFPEDIQIALIKPDGTIIDQTSQDGSITYTSSDSYQSYIIDSPAQGEWQVVIAGVDVKEKTLVLLNVLAVTDLTLSLNLDKESYDSMTPMVVTASLNDDLGSISGASVSALITTPSSTDTLTFLETSKGIYMATYT
ncbi:MAG: triple tyrosine motif-containing protein, partial [bacterium]